MSFKIKNSISFDLLVRE